MPGERDLFDGSSPRLRGTGRRAAPENLSRRFIPAPAGNGRTIWGRSLLGPVHPRACGERLKTSSSGKSSIGSSPRLRGTDPFKPSRIRWFRFIPAPAGNGTRLLRCLLCRAVHPRACGERTVTADSNAARTGSSPRLRGTDESRAADRDRSRFIPAPAGNGPHRTPAALRYAVHPRACGERAEVRRGT